MANAQPSPLIRKDSSNSEFHTTLIPRNMPEFEPSRHAVAPRPVVIAGLLRHPAASGKWLINQQLIGKECRPPPTHTCILHSLLRFPERQTLSVPTVQKPSQPGPATPKTPPEHDLDDPESPGCRYDVGTTGSAFLRATSMSLSEIPQLEALAAIDELVHETEAWADRSTDWAPARRSRALVKRVLTRVETLRVRLEAPLVVATFGGTGTGKSSLVNALVGEECSESGRQRPTTRRPILIAHPRTELDALGLPLDSLEVVRRDADVLRDIVLIDCPDPDTSEGDSSGSNLAILRTLLPYCDVLIYTSTQQKYRSARVLEELGQGANGCRLFFVQTHADLDSDIRDDWRQQLRSGFEVPEIFFVDSRRALEEQQAGQRPSGDFGRLIEALSSQLAASERVGVRRANVLDLLQAAFARSREMLDEASPAVERLSGVLVDQKRNLAGRMAGELREQLLTSRNLWERRLLAEVTDTWGFTPFSAMLRIYSGLGGLIASFSFYRAGIACRWR